MESPAELKSILLGHIVNGTYFLGGFMTSPDLRNLMGGFNQILANGTSKYIFFLKDKSFQCGLMKHLQKPKITGIKVNGTRIHIREGMIAENGAIHSIDHVLLPTNSNTTTTV